jgi:hypothetical protein
VTVENGLASLPKVIRVGPFDVAITFHGREWANDKQGEFDSDAMTVALHEGMPGGAYAASCVLHELFHAIWYAQALVESEEEERAVNALSIGLTQVLRDNPPLIDWLKNVLR